jgi:peptidoglycan/LPS O-acetylase OafA/YrhL
MSESVRVLPRVPSLDTVRGIAVVMVLLSHLWVVWPSWVFAGPFSRAGFLGVDLFFVLSGFLITALLLDEQARTGGIRLAAFYGRRALRLFPALWLLLAVHVVYAWLTGYPPFHLDVELENIQASVLYYMNWRVLWQPAEVGDLSTIWSLAIEEQFYLVWPLAVLLVIGLRRRLANVVAVLVAAIVVVTCWRFYVFEHHGWPSAYLRTDTRIDGLLWGALAACLWVRGWTPAVLPRALLWAAVAVATGVFLVIEADGTFAYAGGLTAFVVAASVIVLVLVSSPVRSPGPLGVISRHVGQLSYGLYLWQAPVLHAFERWGRFRWSNELRGYGAISVTVACALVSRALVERPALRLKARLTPPRGAEPAPSTAAG